MSNILKYDFYKVVHSVWFKVIIAFNLIWPLLTLFPFPRNYSRTILQDYGQSLSGGVTILLVLFAIFLGSMDYNKGYEKKFDRFK